MSRVSISGREGERGAVSATESKVVFLLCGLIRGADTFLLPVSSSSGPFIVL